MLVVSFSTMKNNLKSYCDKVVKKEMWIMDFVEFFGKAITSPFASVIGFVVFLYLVYVSLDFIRKGLKK